MTTEGDLTITLSEPKTRTARDAHKRAFEIIKVEHNGKEVQCKGGRFLHTAPGGAAKKAANRIGKVLNPNGECVMHLWIKERVKSEDDNRADEKSKKKGKQTEPEDKGKIYGYYARRYDSGKQVKLASVDVLKTVDESGQPLSEEAIEQQRKRISDQREKIKKTIPEKNWWIDEKTGDIIGILQDFGYSIETKSLKKRGNADTESDVVSESAESITTA